MNVRQLYVIMFLLMMLWVILYASTRPCTVIQPVSDTNNSLLTYPYSNDQHSDRISYNFGVAFSGGGAKGFTHLGVLKALEERGIKPDVIAGVSAGAVLAALYADGYTPDSIVAMYDTLNFMNYLSLDFSGGLFSLNKFRLLLDTLLRAENFEDLKIPLKVVVTDLDHGTSVVFDKGPLVDALIASCSVPILFNPWVINGVHYVDGGLFHNLPAFALRTQCHTLMGVSLGPIDASAYDKSMMTIALRSYRFVFRSNANYDKSLCDIVLEPKGIEQYDGGDADSVGPLYRLGYRSTLNALDSLKVAKPRLYKKLLRVF